MHEVLLYIHSSEGNHEMNKQCIKGDTTAINISLAAYTEVHWTIALLGKRDQTEGKKSIEN